MCSTSTHTIRSTATERTGSGLPCLQLSEPSKCVERGIERISRAGGRRGAGRTSADAIRWSAECCFTLSEKIEDNEPRVIAEKYREYTKEDDKEYDAF